MKLVQQKIQLNVVYKLLVSYCIALKRYSQDVGRDVEGDFIDEWTILINKLPKGAQLLETLNIEEQAVVAEVWRQLGMNDTYPNRELRLSSVFNRLNNGSYESKYGARKLSLGEEEIVKSSIFPQCISKQESQKEVVSLFGDFMKEMKQLPVGTFSAFLDSLLSLCRCYFWCISSDGYKTTDISFYESLKLSLAFADVLTCDLAVNGEQRFLFVGGDLSGIQKFLYNISSQKAAVSLKGRSFYLQLLIDSIIERVLADERIGMGKQQVVYASGGKFYMILPNLEEVRAALHAIKSEVDGELWENFQGALSFGLATVAFDDLQGDVGALWRKLGDELARKKSRKFESLIRSDYAGMFNARAVGGNVEVCAVSGIECTDLAVLSERSDQVVKVSPIVKEQVALGDALKSADYIVTHRDALYLNDRRTKRANITIAGISNYLFSKDELKAFEHVSVGNTLRVKAINNTDFLGVKAKGDCVAYGYQLYGGNVQAKKGGHHKTFEELAGESYLGVLRMDVDGLGAIFMEGIKKEDRHFARYATLSFGLDLFFSGYLNTIRDRYKDDVNILYSGGDDLFVLGVWTKILAFAADVRREFAEYIGRDDIGISGGVAIVSPKFPLSKAATMAGDAESSAKANIQNGAKNALNVFGESISWNGEWDYVRSWSDRLYDMVKKHKMPKSILHRVMTYARMKDNNELSYLWHMVYSFNRILDKADLIVKENCAQLQREVLNDGRKMKLAAVAARWAELRLKEEDNNNLKNRGYE